MNSLNSDKLLQENMAIYDYNSDCNQTDEQEPSPTTGYRQGHQEAPTVTGSSVVRNITDPIMSIQGKPSNLEALIISKSSEKSDMTEKIIHEKEIGSDNEVETKNHLNLSNGDKERSSPSTSTPDHSGLEL